MKKEFVVLHKNHLEGMLHIMEIADKEYATNILRVFIRGILDAEYKPKDNCESSNVGCVLAELARLWSEPEYERYKAFTDRHSLEYSQWKRAVIERDGVKCVRCGKSTDLHAHHIKPFSKFPELRFDVDNGVTLCKDCHKEIHKR